MPRSRLTLLSWVVAASFVLASVLLYIDRLNLVATPPELPGSATLVERQEGTLAYRQQIWPVFLGTNLLFAVGFVAAVAFAAAIRSAIGGRDGLPTFVSLAATGGIIGAIASIFPLGAVYSSVWLGYCECTSKEGEAVSQLWAQMVVLDISDWLNRFASVVLGVALIVLARGIGAAISPLLRTWTYVTALILVGVPILATLDDAGRFVSVGELATALLGLALIPVWAIWLGRSLEAAGPDDADLTVSTA